MPVPLKIALDLQAENCIDVKTDKHHNHMGHPETARLDPCNSKRLSQMDDLQGLADFKASCFLMDQDLTRIEEAFDRLETGNFGYCVQCNNPIPLEQLEKDPAQSHCHTCHAHKEE